MYNYQQPLPSENDPSAAGKVQDASQIIVQKLMAG
jgi:hypothetical protein